MGREEEYVGPSIALINGAALPLMTILFGGLMDSFGGATNMHDVVHRVSKKQRVFAAVSFVAPPARSYFFAVAGSKLIRRIRSMAFEKVVHMDIGWFDESENSSGAMREHASDFLPFFLSDGNAEADDDSSSVERFEKYCQEVESTAAWGGQLELGALTHCLKKHIVVFSGSFPDVEMGKEYKPETGNNNNPSIRLSYHKYAYGLGEHYNSVVPTALRIYTNAGVFTWKSWWYAACLCVCSVGLSNHGPELERTDLYFEAAVRFLQAASLLKPPNLEKSEYGQGIQSMQIYSDTTNLFEEREMGRAPCCDKANVKRGPWAPKEDVKLKTYIEEHGTGGNWIALPQKIGLKRCGKSCRLRWLNYLRPNIRHGGFSEEEDSIIWNLYINIGSRWSIIAAQLPGRTDNNTKNYWNTKLKKRFLGNKKGQSDYHHLSLSIQDDELATDKCSQSLSSSDLKRMQVHMQVQGLYGTFSFYNNPHSP